MIVQKQLVGNFAKKGEEVKTGDIITILDEGQVKTGKWGDQTIFKVALSNDEEKDLTFNQTSMNNLVDGFGEDTAVWIGKKVKVWINQENVQGSFRDVLYLTLVGRDLKGNIIADAPVAGQDTPPAPVQTPAITGDEAPPPTEEPTT